MTPSETELIVNDESEEEKSQDDPMDCNSVCSIGSLNNLVGEHSENSDAENEMEKRKKCKRGVVYLAYIPPSMNPTILRRLLSEFGTIERIYLQPDLKKGKKQLKNMKNVKYSEGWVEFLKKRDAKKVAALLNNTQMGGKKKSKFREYLWNLKYLSRFKWIHLCERLSYERAVRQQRLRAEVSQAKKIANHFAETVDKEEKQKRRKGGNNTTNPPVEGDSKRFFQKGVKEDKESSKKSEERREDFLKNLFG